jgi:hypothetical protein
MLIGSTLVLAQDGDSASQDLRYFSETGHSVSGEFLKTYISATNPELIYGYPITEAFERDFGFIQYFERARFELRPENPPELRVVITQLGLLLHETSYALPEPGSIPGCRYFPESHFRICYDFLEFFEANGGAAQFGYPISNYEIRNGLMVQNFQRARLEWHPELPSGEQILPADLGKEYFTLMNENPVRLLSVQPPGIAGDTHGALVTELQLRGFFENSVTHSNGEQTAFIILQDQKVDGVPDAKITLEIQGSDGNTLETVELTTNKYGFIEHTFSFNDQPPGRAKVKITAEYENLRETSNSSFWIWH